MCGIVAVIHGDPSSSSAAADLHDALFMLQHRGQDACGIATCGPGGKIYQCKGNGMASKVFHEGARVNELYGSMGIAHLRYPTAGTSANAEAQPFYTSSPYGLTFATNGNVINAPELKKYLDEQAHRHVNTDSDSELMLNIFANELNETGKARVNSNDIFSSLERTYARCKGGWASVAMVAGYGLIGFRDPHGIRPLCMGSRMVDGKKDWMFASESVALQFWGADEDSITDIGPGQAVIIEKGGKPTWHEVQKPLAYAPDIFEFVYFARPDSIIDKISVYKARKRMGEKLAAKILRQLGPLAISQIDAVIPIPETSTTSARCVAEHLFKPLVDGFIKNRYIFRTFIMPTQRLRKTGVRRKLNAMKLEFKDKNVLLVDDSIVRGTTSKEIVQMAREAGAKKVFFASCAPPITHAHIYGIDLASSNELIAFRKSHKEIAAEIGADAVVYQELPDLEAACAEVGPNKEQRFEVGVFCGKYVTPVEEGYFEHLEMVRGARAKEKLVEKARENVQQGVASEEEVLLVAKGATVSSSGKIVPAGGEEHGHMNGINGEQGKRKKAGEEGSNGEEKKGNGAWAGRSQDVSLYNLNDHDRA